MMIAVIGGGASGLIASLRARSLGAEVMILERQPRVGKKLLATGNGRCNMTHIGASPSDYHGDTHCMEAAMSAYPPDKIIEYFQSLGIEPLIDNDLVYPRSEQAHAVLDALRLTAETLGVRTICDYDVNRIAREGSGFLIQSADGRGKYADKIIMTCGGPAAPALGGTDAGLFLLQSLGHKCMSPLPALVQLQTDTHDTRGLSGIKFKGSATIMVNDQKQRTERGEILFTDYGLSGIAILQLSRIAAQALHRKKRVSIALHVADDVDMETLRIRRKRLHNLPVEHFLSGLINKRLGQVLLKLSGCGSMSKPICELSDFELEGILLLLNNWPIEVIDTQGFEGAQVTAGGAACDQFDPGTLESRLIKGLYAAGELLNIDGDCGGYNLQWAWASGLFAADHAAKGDR